MPGGVMDGNPEYKEFRVEVLDLQRVRVTRTSGVPMPGTVHWDRLTEATFSVFDTQLAEGRTRGRLELEVIGGHLFRTLFDAAVARAFLDDLANVEERRRLGDPVVMRLKLEFQPAATVLAGLPWEYLYATEANGDKGRFIAADQQLVLTRFVPMASGQPGAGANPSEERLRILAVVSAPERGPKPGTGSDGDDAELLPLGKILYQDVLTQLDALAEQQPERFLVRTMDAPPTRRALADLVADVRPHVLHFIGHGSYDRMAGKGYLALADEHSAKTALWVDDVTFADCLKEHPPRLVFLQSCEGAHTDSYRSFRGVALRMVEESVGAVVAMQYKIENKVATAFATKFYEALAKGAPVDLAVQSGRREVGRYTDPSQIYSSRAFGSPVALVQTADGIVVASGVPPTPRLGAAAGQPVTVRPGAPVPAAMTPCPWDGCHGMLRPRDRFCQSCGKRVVRCPQCDECLCDERAAPAGLSDHPALSLATNVSQAPAKFYCSSCGYDIAGGLAAAARHGWSA